MPLLPTASQGKAINIFPRSLLDTFLLGIQEGEVPHLIWDWFLCVLQQKPMVVSAIDLTMYLWWVTRTMAIACVIKIPRASLANTLGLVTVRCLSLVWVSDTLLIREPKLAGAASGQANRDSGPPIHEGQSLFLSILITTSITRGRKQPENKGQRWRNEIYCLSLSRAD